MSVLTLRCSQPLHAKLPRAEFRDHGRLLLSNQNRSTVRRAQVRRFSTVKASATTALTVFSPSKSGEETRGRLPRSGIAFPQLEGAEQVIDLGDSLAFTPLPGASQDQLTCNMEGVPTDSSNLVIKCILLGVRGLRIPTKEVCRACCGRGGGKRGAGARPLQTEDRSLQLYNIALEKVVPHGAGLGGGSGNAAAALWAANELSGRPATDAQLSEWAGEIGSDISVFFSNGAAYCTGRGEVVEDVKPPLPLDTPLLLVKPAEGLSTPEVFRALDLNSRSTADPLNLLARLGEGQATPELCINDLEPPAFSKMPALLALKERLIKEGGNRFSAVFMSGSGSTIVCVGSDEPPAFLSEPQYKSLFVAPARLIARKPGDWYQPSTPALLNVAA